MLRVLLAIVCILGLTGARDPILVPEVSQNEIIVQQGFTGTELLLFGAVLDQSGARARGDYDIVVVLKGPTQSVTLREKKKLGPMWVNAASTDFRSVPSFFAVASSSPIRNIVDERTAAIYELGLDFIQLSPGGVVDPAEQMEFSKGLIDLRTRQGLFNEDDRGVTIKKHVLYKARIALPSNVTTGIYTAETFAVSNGQVISSAIAEVEVKKIGFERLIEFLSKEWEISYGVFAVLLSVGMGWLAGRIYALV